MCCAELNQQINTQVAMVTRLNSDYSPDSESYNNNI